ncbi:MAG: MMPL family transporter, partial [Clostridia bacterium]|nr:MMPL family transporter [Clostridia bacterium]
MKMDSKFAKARKYIVIAIFLVIAGLSVLLSKNVAINYNISDYLDESTETKISLGIIEDEFGVTGDIQVMIEDVSVEDAKDVLETLKDIDNVLSVSFNEYDEGYYKDNSALFVVVVDGDEYSETANNVLADIKDALDDKFDGKINYGGAVMEKANLRESIEGEIPFVLAIAVCFVIVIMLLTSASWIEPIILLFVSGVAILINMGTNAIFGEISYITNAVAAILQLALSIDYSIVLLHSYRKLKETGADNGKAMKCAIKEIVKPISASALTTIAGLLALLFMSMKIGFDIGIVLMKGIAISAIVSLTFLPAVLLVFDTPLNKTKKKELVLKGKSFGDMAFKACKVILPIALVIIIAGSVLQFSNTYTFTDSDKFNTVISDAFGRNNTVVVVYPNGDDSYDKEIDLVEKLNDYKTDDGRHVLKNHTAYSNTVRELYDVEKASRKLGIPEKDVELLFTMYHLYADSSKVTVTPADFIKYAEGQLTDSEDVQEFASEEMTSTIRTMLMISRMMNGEYTAAEFHDLTTSGIMEGTGLSQFAIRQLYGLYLYDTITDSTVDLEAMLDFMIGAMGNAELASMVDANTAANLVTLSQGIKQFNSQMEAPLTMEQFRMYMYQNYGMAMDAAAVAQIYGGYYQMQGQPMQDGIPFLKLMTFLASQGQISDPTAAATISSYNALYSTVNAKYAYSQFLPVLVEAATSLSGAAPDVSVTDAAVQQMYIMYFYTQGMMPATAVQGRELI